MKTILIAILFLAPVAASAQDAAERDRATQRSCDDLMGPDKELCLKQGGTVKANTAGKPAAAGGSSATQRSEPASAQSSSERTAEPEAKKDYTKRDSK